MAFVSHAHFVHLFYEYEDKQQCKALDICDISDEPKGCGRTFGWNYEVNYFFFEGAEVNM